MVNVATGSQRTGAAARHETPAETALSGTDCIRPARAITSLSAGNLSRSSAGFNTMGNGGIIILVLKRKLRNDTLGGADDMFVHGLLDFVWIAISQDIEKFVVALWSMLFICRASEIHEVAHLWSHVL